MRPLLRPCAVIISLVAFAACSDAPASSETDGSARDAAPEAGLESESADDTTVVGLAVPDTNPVTIVSLTPGDRACYLSVRIASGATSEVMADFGMCERDDLIGRQVILTRSLSMVLAESCGGNPECTDTEQVMLVVGVDPVVPGAARAVATDSIG